MTYYNLCKYCGSRIRIRRYFTEQDKQKYLILEDVPDPDSTITHCCNEMLESRDPGNLKDIEAVFMAAEVPE